MSTDLANLEFTADEMRRMGYATIERLVDRGRPSSTSWHGSGRETARRCG